MPNQTLRQIENALESLNNWQPTFTCWFPHCGGRWLNRGLIGRHEKIQTSEAFSPLITASLDDLLALDTTFQVHKSRTQEDRKDDFSAIVNAMNDAQYFGLLRYFYELQRLTPPNKHFYAALPVGSRIAVPHLNTMQLLMPKMNLIHLIRNPIDCFASLKSRAELNGDPSLAAAHWLRLNHSLRHYGSQLGSQYLLVKYEDLCRKPKDVSGKVLALIGLSWQVTMNEGINEYHGRNQGIDLNKTVTPAERKIIKEICGKEASEYGYDL